MEGPAYAHATVKNTLVALWTGDPTLKQLERFWAELDMLARRQPDGIHVFNVISDTTGIPDHRARELLRLQFDAMRGRVLALAIVLEHRGVLASVSRALLSTLLVLSRRPFVMAVHTDLDGAARWLSQRERALPAAKLIEISSALRRQVVR